MTIGQTIKEPQAAQQLKLAECDGKTIAIVMTLQGQRQVLRGQGWCVPNGDKSTALRVEVDDEESGNPALIFAEGEWVGAIAPDLRYGCDVCIELPDAPVRNDCMSHRHCNSSGGAVERR